jgi:hypothetical protein
MLQNSVGTAYGSVLSLKHQLHLAAGQSYQGGIIAYISNQEIQGSFQENPWFNYNYVKPEYRDSMGLFRNFN